MATSRPSRYGRGTPRERSTHTWLATLRCAFSPRDGVVWLRLATDRHLFIQNCRLRTCARLVGTASHISVTSSPTWHFSRANILGGSNARASVLPPRWSRSSSPRAARTRRSPLARASIAAAARRPTGRPARRPVAARPPPLDSQSPRRQIARGVAAVRRGAGRRALRQTGGVLGPRRAEAGEREQVVETDGLPAGRVGHRQGTRRHPCTSEAKASACCSSPHRNPNPTRRWCAASAARP